MDCLPYGINRVDLVIIFHFSLRSSSENSQNANKEEQCMCVRACTVCVYMCAHTFVFVISHDGQLCPITQVLRLAIAAGRLDYDPQVS